MRANYKMQRLYLVEFPRDGGCFSPNKEQSHYLLHVIRIKLNQNILIFDGKHGEWLAECIEINKKTLKLKAIEQVRKQPSVNFQLIYCFAPLKHARLDYMVQKAVELGASVLQPVMTQHTQAKRVNIQRLESNIIEATEQCGALKLAQYFEPTSLTSLVANWQENWGENAPLIFCDEGLVEQDTGGERRLNNNLVNNNSVSAILQQLSQEYFAASNSSTRKVGLFIGPEGGFSEQERDYLYQQKFVTSIPLGSRILRADTAAVAALTLIQSNIGDW